MDTPAPIPIPATCPGFFRRLFSWKRVRKVLFVLAALITLAALLLAEEDWRGSRAWANYKRAMEAKGERFDAARLIPPKVPDDQNFAMTPLFAPLFDLPPEVLRQPIAYQRDTNFPLSKVTNSDTGQKVVFYVTIQRVTNILTEFRLPYWPNWTNRFTWY